MVSIDRQYKEQCTKLHFVCVWEGDRERKKPAGTCSKLSAMQDKYKRVKTRSSQKSSIFEVQNIYTEP